MPDIKVQHVVSCSSEDKNCPADNLLKSEGTHKWKCATAGEKQASIVLQFEKSSQISSIDIGNEGSAFVEVLVGRATATADADYQVILVASSFMTPLEARNGTNRTSVRMFGPDKLTKTVSSEKWDRVKVVCTQPFNKTSAFGLSFIKFHSPSDGTKEEQQKVQKKLGFFSLKKEEGDDISAGSLFSNRDKMAAKAETTAPLTGAAAVRAASRLAEEARAGALSTSTPGKSPQPSTSAPGVSVVKKATKPVSTPSPTQKRKHSVSDDDTEEDMSSRDAPKPSLRKQSTSLSSTASSTKGERPPPIKKTKSEPPKESPVQVFSKIMDKVVFVLSGFQNPYRGELRDRAMEMGAVYKPDWGRGCTHLVCAFPNTPKFNQVNGKGKIIKKEWINDCYKQKKLLPWRKYRLGDADSPSESSDEDDEDDYVPYKKATPQNPTPQKKPSLTSTSQKKSKVKDEDLYGGDTDEGGGSSGEDTEDDVRKAKALIAKAKVKIAKASGTAGAGDGADPYGESTDEDEPSSKSDTSKTSPKTKTSPKVKASPKVKDTDDGSDSGLPELPDFFTDKHFFFYGNMSASERRTLTRYISAYDGEVEEYMNDNVNFVVTSSPWDDNFDEALSENPSLVFIKPKWIHVCHDKKKLMPHQPYIVVPD